MTTVFDPGLMQNNFDALAANSYPGRGIVLGVSKNGEQAVQAYWLMGRSENSRNRVLVHDRNMVKTEAFDPSKLEDPSLIIYNALIATTQSRPLHIVSNGDQTDTVHKYLVDTDSYAEQSMSTLFRHALLTREFEPDAPNFTPRITGMYDPFSQTYDYSIIRRNETTGQAEYVFSSGQLDQMPNGAGLCFHTYEGDALSKDEGIPSFRRNPYAIPLGNSAAEIAETIWSALDSNNRVALVVKTIDRRSGEVAIKLVNQLQNPEAA